jgi:hypothetical protein
MPEQTDLAVGEFAVRKMRASAAIIQTAATQTQSVCKPHHVRPLTRQTAELNSRTANFFTENPKICQPNMNAGSGNVAPDKNSVVSELWQG